MSWTRSGCFRGCIWSFNDCLSHCVSRPVEMAWEGSGAARHRHGWGANDVMEVALVGRGVVCMRPQVGMCLWGLGHVASR